MRMQLLCVQPFVYVVKSPRKGMFRPAENSGDIGDIKRWFERAETGKRSCSASACLFVQLFRAEARLFSTSARAHPPWR